MSKAHWLALATLPGIGGVTLRALIERFGSVEAAFDAPADELLEVPRVTADVVARLRAISIPALEAELLSMSEEGLEVLTWEDDDYPPGLRMLHDAPPLLFVYGLLLPADLQAVAIVGTRQASPRGVEQAAHLARELAARGLTIVSGLARGIDSAAHRGALQAEGGRTLAVLGSGVRVIHPRENVPLAREIISRGALISELRPDAPALGRSLMARDRIVSGLSKAVILVEGAEKSGSVDTARKALRQGRLLLAVPGSPGADALLDSGDAQPLDPERVDLDELSGRIWDLQLAGQDEPPAGQSAQLGFGF
mgnify:CR=1 FL=1